MDDYSKSRYNIIPGGDTLTVLLLKLKVLNTSFKELVNYFEGSTAPIIYLGKYEFKDSNTGKIIPE